MSLHRLSLVVSLIVSALLVGVMAAPSNAQEGPLVDLQTSTDAPVCMNSGHRIVIVRSFDSSRADWDHRADLIRNRLARMNWKLMQQAQLSGGPPLELKVECDPDGRPKVYESLSDEYTPAAWRSAASDLFEGPDGQLPRGADAIKILVFRDEVGSDGQTVVSGAETVKSSSDTVETHGDPDSFDVSASNGYRVTSTIAVIAAGLGFDYQAWEQDHGALHELFHAMGAVAGREIWHDSDTAPFAEAEGHCNDGIEMMCYAFGNPNYTSTRCPATAGYATPEGLPIDCGYDTYFDAAPEPGEWLDRHWNVGGPENPYLHRPPEWSLAQRRKGLSRLQDVHCVSASDCVAVGVKVTTQGIKENPIVARWDGSEWSTQIVPIPSGAVQGQLTGVSCMSASSCLAVGTYSEIASPTVNNMRPLSLRWDGSSWSLETVPRPTGAGSYHGLEVACYSTGCIAVGAYTPLSGSEISLGLRWSGTSWTSVTLPLPAGSTSSRLVDVECPSAFACQAVGTFRDDGETRVMLMHHQVGSWTAQAGPSVSGATGPVRLGDLSCGNGTCVVVGDLLESSSGLRKPFAFHGPLASSASAWSIDTVPVPTGATRSGLTGVACTSSTACRAVGHYVNAAAVEVPLGVAWNGSSWSLDSPGTPARATAAELLGVSCASTSACMAVGMGAFSSGEFFVGSELDSGSWSDAGDGSSESDATGVSCTAAKACVSVVESSSGPVAKTWNGDRWSAMPALASVDADDALEAVSCSAADACTAVGSKDSEDDVLIQRWNGTLWAAQAASKPSGSSEADLADVSCASASTCVAVGRHRDGGGTQLPLIESWNGSAWSVESVPAPSGATSTQLSGVDCFSTSACVAVGSYDDASGEHYYAVKWNGTSWTLLGLPSNAAPTRLVDVACDAATQCTMVGSKVDSGARKPLALWWAVGIYIQDFPALPTGATAGELHDVSRVGGATAVGSYLDAAGVRKTYTLLRRGGASSWSVTPSPNAPAQATSELTELSCSAGGECMAAGKSTGSGLSQPLFESYQ